MKLEELQERIGKLNTLINDPHPGIASWCICFGDMMNELCEKWNADGAPVETPKDPRRRILAFGSNTRGRHGKGAALTARRFWGAKEGKGYGLEGNSWAIPTRKFNVAGQLITLPLENIAYYVNVFLRYAKDNPSSLFLVTRIGCGYAGYTDEQIAPMFAGAPENCHFDPAWAVYGLKTWEESPDEYVRSQSA